MRHPDDIRLNDYVDDRLDPAFRFRIDVHLAACSDCRARVEAIRELMTRLDALPTGIRPRRDLRPARPAPADRTAPASRPGALWRRPWLRVAAVAALLVGAGVGAWLGVGRQGEGPAPAAGPRAPVAASYARAGDELAAAFRARRAELSPAVARALETSLASVEAAIRELQTATATGEEAVELARHLEARHRTRLELLRGALALLEGS